MSADTSSRWNENQFDTEPWPDAPFVPQSVTVRQIGKNLQMQLQLNAVSIAEATKNLEKLVASIAPPPVKAVEPTTPPINAHWQAPAPNSRVYDSRGRKLY